MPFITKSKRREFGILNTINWNSYEYNSNIEFHKINLLKKMSPKDIENHRKIFQITITKGEKEDPILDLEEAQFPSEIMDALRKSNITKPTPIQSQAWPIVFKGKNLIGVAQTGSGKTLAFLLPAILYIKFLKKTNKSRRGPPVIIISPTRELSKQIYFEAKKYGQNLGVQVGAATGGDQRRQQMNVIQSGIVDLIVGTPGRIIDFLQEGILNCTSTSMLIIDEADRMLDMGFEPQVRKICSQVPPQRQTLLFTATWPPQVQQLSYDFIESPTKINIGSLNTAAVHSVKQIVKVVDRRDKFDLLTQEIIPGELKNGGKVLVFATTKKGAKFLFEKVAMITKNTMLIHGEKTQFERDTAIEEFSKGKCDVLIATDVAQRGLDIPCITCVVNYDFPRAIEDYVHRIGRTGRAGKKGVSHTFFTKDDVSLALSFIKVLEEANQEVPQTLRELAEKGESLEILREFPKPWNERTEEEKNIYNTVPLEIKSYRDETDKLDEEKNNYYSNEKINNYSYEKNNYGKNSPDYQNNNYGRNSPYNYGRNQGDNYGRNQNDNYGRNQNDNYGRYQNDYYGRYQGDNYSRNKGDNYGRNQGDNYDRYQNDNYSRNQGDNYDRNQGDNYGRNQSDNYGRNQGDNYDRNQNDNYGRNKGDNYGRNQSDNYGRNQGDNYGRNQGDNYGRNQNDNYGRNGGFNERNSFGHTDNRENRYNQNDKNGHFSKNYNPINRFNDRHLYNNNNSHYGNNDNWQNRYDNDRQNNHFGNNYNRQNRYNNDRQNGHYVNNDNRQNRYNNPKPNYGGYNDNDYGNKNYGNKNYGNKNYGNNNHGNHNYGVDKNGQSKFGKTKYGRNSAESDRGESPNKNKYENGGTKKFSQDFEPENIYGSAMSDHYDDFDDNKTAESNIKKSPNKNKYENAGKKELSQGFDPENLYGSAMSNHNEDFDNDSGRSYSPMA